jgi:hypothetical protein
MIPMIPMIPDPTLDQPERTRHEIEDEQTDPNEADK